jgi:hypothetical protein
MASSLQELQTRQKALETKLVRLINLKNMTAKPDKSLLGDIHMTQLYLDDVRSKIDGYNKR